MNISDNLSMYRTNINYNDIRYIILRKNKYYLQNNKTILQNTLIIITPPRLVYKN